MKKILFLHGFFASGSCVPALALKQYFDGRATVLTPDLPLQPDEAIRDIRAVIDRERPALLVGNSCGSFYAQMLSSIVGVPTLLGNPHFEMSKFLKERIGRHEYKSARADGRQDFVIDDRLVAEFETLEREQFKYCNPYYRDRVWGMFGENDTLAHYENTFLEHYNESFHFPGGHTPTEQEVVTWYVPIIERLMMTYQPSENGIRFFQHFKGGKYRYIRTAFDSETQERMVVYQALYGERAYWVRPEKMFFENIERNGRTFARFAEIDNEQETKDEDFNI